MFDALRHKIQWIELIGHLDHLEVVNSKLRYRTLLIFFETIEYFSKSIRRVYTVEDDDD